MFCAQCGRAVEAGASFCMACGALVAPATPAPVAALQGHGMDREHWALLLLLNAVTLGAYGLWWWWSRAGRFDALRSPKKFGSRALFLVLLLAPIGSILQLGAQYAEGRLFNPEAASALPTPLEVAGIGLSVVAAISGVVFAFIARRMLLDHYHSQGRADVHVSALWTFLFNLVYLQYKLRRLP